MTSNKRSIIAFSGRKAALLTKHEKLPLVSPYLLEVGLSVSLTSAFNTDELGTFSGEIARKLLPVECARQKAKLAIELTGLDVGIGSEGSFGGGPMPGLMNWDDEILVLYDALNDFEIVSLAQGPVKASDFSMTSLSVLKKHLDSFDKDQAWILKTDSALVKGLKGYREISLQLEKHGLLSESQYKQQQVRLEPDLRAMNCPERQYYIRQAAQQLSQRIQSLCPSCNAPDFWRAEAVRGAPCLACGLPSDVPKAFIKRCTVCQLEEQEPSDTQFIEPGQCQLCNP